MVLDVTARQPIAPQPCLAGRCWFPSEVDGGRAAHSITPSQETAKRKCTSRKAGTVTDSFAGIA